MSQSEKKKNFVQLIQFVLVGVSNTLVDLIVCRLLQALFGTFAVSAVWVYYFPKVVGYACGILNSYVLNSNWTFREEKRHDRREVITFLAVNLFTLGLSLLLMFLLKDVFATDLWWQGLVGTEGLLGKVITGSFFCTVLSTGITLLVNFLGNKLLVFTGKRNK